jgi:hypothetical protein
MFSRLVISRDTVLILFAGSPQRQNEYSAPRIPPASHPEAYTTNLPFANTFRCQVVSVGRAVKASPGMPGVCYGWRASVIPHSPSG